VRARRRRARARRARAGPGLGGRHAEHDHPAGRGPGVDATRVLHPGKGEWNCRRAVASENRSTATNITIVTALSISHLLFTILLLSRHHRTHRHALCQSYRLSFTAEDGHNLLIPFAMNLNFIARSYL